MSSALVPRALLHWDGFSLRLDLDILETVARKLLAVKAPWLELRRIGGEAGWLEIEVTSHWQVLRFSGTVRLSELRLHRRFLGCRLDTVRGPLGIPVPFGLLASVLERHAAGMVRLDPEDHVLLVDLRRVLPAAIEVRIVGVRCTGRWLELEVAPGSVAATLTADLAGLDG